ncbi:MAG: hypothetical protein WCQ00_02765 [bacterium]
MISFEKNHPVPQEKKHDANGAEIEDGQDITFVGSESIESGLENNVEKNPEPKEEMLSEQEIGGEVLKRVSAIETIKNGIEFTADKLSSIRGSLGMKEGSSQEPPSISSERARIKTLEDQISTLESDRSSKDENPPKQVGAFNGRATEMEDGMEGRKVKYMTDENKDKLKEGAFLFNGQHFNVGEEVIADGKRWFVRDVRAGRIASNKEPDWDADPMGRITKEVAKPSEMGLVGVNGGFREYLSVTDGMSSVEKVTPEALARFKKMKETTQPE